MTDIANGKKLTDKQKIDVLYELMFHMDATGSKNIHRELRSHLRKEHAGVHQQSQAHFYPSAKRINDILSPAGIESDGSARDESDPHIKTYLDANFSDQTVVREMVC